MGSRVREMHQAKTVVLSGLYTSSPTSGLDTPYSSTYDVWFESSRIEDVAQVRQRIKPVLHLKSRWNPQEWPTYLTDAGSPWYHQTTSGAPIACPVGPNIPPLWVQSPSSGVKVEMADKAFDAFSTQVPQQVDIANFLLDFREVGSLIPSLAENLPRTVGGGFLTYSFGWAPLIGDLQKLSNIMESTRARLAWLKRTYGVRTPLGFSGEWVNPHAPVDFQQGTFNISVKASTATFRAGCYLTQRLNGLDGLQGELRALSGALGLTSPGKIVWERIPFSFIADWVSRAGSIADKWKVQPFTGEWIIQDLSHSWKQRVEAEVRFLDNYGFDNRGSVAGTLVAESYERGPGLPLSSAFFYGRELNTQQLALSAALIGAASK
jgi:hypothetical protein